MPLPTLLAELEAAMAAAQSSARDVIAALRATAALPGSAMDRLGYHKAKEEHARAEELVSQISKKINFDRLPTRPRDPAAPVTGNSKIHGQNTNKKRRLVTVEEHFGPEVPSQASSIKFLFLFVFSFCKDFPLHVTRDLLLDS